MLERMLERGVSRSKVIKLLHNGEIIERYEDDKPYPSILIHGEVEEEILHAVIAIDKSNNTCYIITVYKPDDLYFESDKKTRRKK